MWSLVFGEMDEVTELGSPNVFVFTVGFPSPSPTAGPLLPERLKGEAMFTMVNGLLLDGGTGKAEGITLAEGIICAETDGITLVDDIEDIILAEGITLKLPIGALLSEELMVLILDAILEAILDVMAFIVPPPPPPPPPGTDEKGRELALAPEG